MLKINLNSSKLSKISNIAKRNKFSLVKEEFIYCKNVEEKLKVLVNCFRFLENLSNINYENENKTTKDIKKELKDFLDKIKNIIRMIDNFNNEYKSTIFGKSFLEDEINSYISKNYKQLNYVADFCYEFGKIIQFFNPDEDQGYY